jgi:hypothetical protein
VEELQRIVKQIRAVWPQVRILVRGDSGFCREELMAWCEAEHVDYALGLAKNERLKAEVKKELTKAKRQYRETKRAARFFKDFYYQTRKSWSQRRRVVAKAEHLEKGENPRFEVTSLTPAEWPAPALYEQLYCARGHGESHQRTADVVCRSHQHGLSAE